MNSLLFKDNANLNSLYMGKSSQHYFPTVSQYTFLDVINTTARPILLLNPMVFYFSRRQEALYMHMYLEHWCVCWNIPLHAEEKYINWSWQIVANDIRTCVICVKDNTRGKRLALLLYAFYVTYIHTSRVLYIHTWLWKSAKTYDRVQGPMCWSVMPASKPHTHPQRAVRI